MRRIDEISGEVKKNIGSLVDFKIIQWGLRNLGIEKVIEDICSIDLPRTKCSDKISVESYIGMIVHYSKLAKMWKIIAEEGYDHGE